MSDYQDHARADDRTAEPDTKKLRDCTAGELLDAGYIVMVAHPKRPGVFDAAYGEMTHPAKYELRYHDDQSLKGLTAHVRFSAETES